MPVLSHPQVMPGLIAPLGDGKTVWPGRLRVVFKTYGEGTGGALCVVEHLVEAGRVKL